MTRPAVPHNEDESPAIADHASPRTHMTTQPRGGTETVSRILLVEDDEEIAAMVVEMLRENGLEAVVVALCASGQPDQDGRAVQRRLSPACSSLVGG